jgi:hypothetical protein
MNTGASYDKRGSGILASFIGTAPVLGTGTSMAPNPAYYANATWGRDTYLVAEYARVVAGASYDANLAALLDPAVANSLANSSTTTTTKAGSVKLKFGLLPPTTGLVPFRVLKTP